MGMLAFFPWLRIPERLDLGTVELLPHRRGGPGDEAQAIDAVTRSYKEHGGNAIAAVTLLRCAGNILADLAPTEINEAFAVSEFAAVTGLADRQYFHHCGYLNRDNFQLVIQGFTEPGKGVARVTRRRDGNTTAYVTGDRDVVPCPVHVRPAEVELDRALLTALLGARDRSDGDSLVDGVISFNLANTDADALSPHVELVLVVGAFERLLGCKGGSDRDLAERFTGLLVPMTGATRPSCARLQAATARYPNAQSVREVWVRDLYALRGDLAHGKVAQRYPSIWTLQEHLLLAAFAFPLVLKGRLAVAGLYAITERDKVAIESFEQLACVADIMKSLDEDEMQWPWIETLSRVENELAIAATLAKLTTLRRGSDDADGP